MTIVDLANQIGGHPVPHHTGTWLDDVDPSTGQVIARIPRSVGHDVDAAVEAARTAAEGWGRRSFEARAEVLEAVAVALEDRADALARLESLDQGKPVALARRVDIPRAVANFRFFAGAIRHQTLPSHPSPGALNYTLRQPLGVVGTITPWNLPLYLLTWKVAPALAMGNTVVAKPSELTPRTADALATVFRDVGAPPGLFNVVHGLGPEAGAPLVAHEGVKAVSFTGGTATGAKVAAATAGRFKKVSLELGGKNATIVFDDADLDAALEGAVRAGFANQGEICLCGSRLLVQRGVYDAFVERLVARVGALTVGDPRDPSTDVGALVSAAHRDKVAGYVELARELGGTIRTGGRAPSLPGDLGGGFYYEPTVITGLAPTCRPSTEEIFGPVLTVHPFDTEEEALHIAHGTRYGLAASVWTSDLQRAHRVAAALEVGMVWVNTWLYRDLRTPFGGARDSGVGREGGRWSLDFYSQTKNVCIALGPGDPAAGR